MLVNILTYCMLFARKNYANRETPQKLSAIAFSLFSPVNLKVSLRLQSFQRQPKHVNKCVWTLNNLYVIWFSQKPGLMSWETTSCCLKCVWGQISSACILVLFTLTPSWGKEEAWSRTEVIRSDLSNVKCNKDLWKIPDIK